VVGVSVARRRDHLNRTEQGLGGGLDLTGKLLLAVQDFRYRRRSEPDGLREVLEACEVVAVSRLSWKWRERSAVIKPIINK
jgi:hypothetical protein